MKKIAALFIAVCLMLGGCANVFDGHYVSVTPYEEQQEDNTNQTVSAVNFDQLCQALRSFTNNGSTSGVISIGQYQGEYVSTDMALAISQTRAQDPITAYAVDEIFFEVGNSAGKPAIALEITYHHDRSELLRLRSFSGMDDAKKQISQALEKYSTGAVMYIENYEETDLAQWVEDYSALHPDTVMETPQTTVGVYPESGTARIVELKFQYQTSRDSLRSMQEQVSPMFEAASLYVSGSSRTREKYAQLYAFLMERFEGYTLETSITPAYSLLNHGVGDSKAFATVYSAMCRQAELECLTVAGTRNGTVRYWNIILDGNVYYHVDLLQCSAAGGFRTYRDGQMTGYVWDYSAYPPCGVAVKIEREE